MTNSDDDSSLAGRFSRRTVLRGAAVGTAGAAVAGLVGACGGSSTGSSTTAGSGHPKRGGTLRIGLGDGGPSDVMDPATILTLTDQSYAQALYDQLTLVDEDMVVRNRLAEECEPSKDGSYWTIRLRDGVEFHNGKTLDADDVIYTFQRLFNPKYHATDAWIGGFVSSMRKLDPRTVRFEMKGPMGWFDIAAGDGGATGIVPVGFDSKKPVGTGPFQLVSFTPGQEAVFKRFPNYWDGDPYLDEVIMLTIDDDTARLNALLTGQIQMNGSMLATQASQVKAASNLKLYTSPTSQFTTFTMRTDIPPFDDVRVRQALRLCINRSQVLVETNSGYGFVGNDLYSPYDPAFDHTLVRHQDAEQAKSLLRQAGRSDLAVQLVVAEINPGVVAQAQVIAQNASEIGANISIRQVDAATLYGPNYLSWPFAVDTFPGLRYLTTSALADGPNASINETHFKNPHYDQLWNEASATLDHSRRTGLIKEMQQILFDQGGFIIPVFPSILAGMVSNLGGYASHDYRGYPPGAASLQKLYLA